jgi:hypothetical protein
MTIYSIEYLFQMDMEGSSRGLNRCNIAVFAWNDPRISRNSELEYSVSDPRSEEETLK